MIIEEPGTDLDEGTKNLLDDTTTRLLPGRTAIFLPHRVSTLPSCNTSHLINKGRIVASGTHKELLSGNKLYLYLHYLLTLLSNSSMRSSIWTPPVRSISRTAARYSSSLNVRRNSSAISGGVGVNNDPTAPAESA